MKYQAPFGSVDLNAGYVDRNTPGAVTGSKVPAKAIEQPQREMAAVLTGAGFTPSDSDLSQLAKAVRSQKLNYVAAGGTANALTGTLSIVPASWAELTNVPLIVKSGANPNTGSATLNLNSLGTKSIVRMDGSPLQAGDIPASSYIPVFYDGTNVRNLLAGGPNAPARGRVTWDAAGTDSWVASTPGYVLARTWGAGGGGGGANSTSAPASGSGGGGGGYAEKWIYVDAGDSLAIVIGAGGARGSTGGGNGGTGGSSSVGAVVTAPGGTGGNGGVDAVGTGGVAGGAPSTGDVNFDGSAGGSAILIDGVPVGGAGGAAPYFSNYGISSQSTGGLNGPMPGAGGGGASRLSAAGGALGGLGADGLVIIEY